MTVTPERRGENDDPKRFCGLTLQELRALYDAYGLLLTLKVDRLGPEFLRRLATAQTTIVELNAERSSLLSALDEADARIAAERERAAQIAESSTDVTTEASARKIADRIRKA